MAEERTELAASLRKGDGCDFLFASDCDELVLLARHTAAIQAGTLSLKLITADNPAAPAGYIGPAPDEIRSLVGRTLGALSEFKRAEEVFPGSSCLKMTNDQNCIDTNDRAATARRELQDALLAWEPYL